MNPTGRTVVPLALALALAVLAPGCRTATEFRSEADEEVYSILEERRAELLENPDLFTIEAPENTLRDRLLSGEQTAVAPLDMLDSLEIAAENNREYQRRRELLYLVALQLTFERWQFNLQTRGALGASWDKLIGSTEVAAGDADFTLTKLLGSGAVIVGDVGLSVFRDLTSGNGWDLVGNAGLTITQPLLRGYGREIVLEPLTQAERDVVYEVRSYERFRRSFAVDVATRLYGILQQKDVVKNETANIERLQTLRERNEALEQAGRMSDIDVDQARQDEVNSRNRLIVAQQRYLTLIDDFNLFLGLPIELALTIDPAELEQLHEALELELGLGEQEMIAIALAERLDYHTALEVVEDAERQVVITKDALRAALDVVAGIDVTSEAGKPFTVNKDLTRATIGINFDLPIQRLPERNAYRAALIDLDLAQRNAEQLADSITADVRLDLRDAETTRLTYSIQRGASELAARRVESARLRLEAGRATTRDILEAQEALLQAQNLTTAALIAHRLSQLALFRDMEILRVDETGIAVERSLLETRTES
jgi:outer membrane protein TolC